MTLRETIENHPAIIFISTVLAGFVAGIAAYNKGLDVLDYKIVPPYKLESLEEDRKELKEENEKLRDRISVQQILLAERGYIEKHKATDNDDAKNKKAAIERERERKTKEISHNIKIYSIITIAVILVIIVFCALTGIG